MKLSDKIIFSLVIIFITLSWCLFIFDNWITATVVTVVVFILFSVAYSFYSSRKRALKAMTAHEMCQSFALLGQDAATTHIFNVLPPGMATEHDCQYIFAEYKDKKIIIMNNYKFSNTSEDDIAKAYRRAKASDIQEIYLLSRFTDRKIMVFAANLDVNFTFVDKKVIRKYLIERNALPPLFSYDKKKKPPINYKEIIDIALDSKRIKYYFFTGSILFIMSFFTPLKLYYLVISTLPLALAALSALRSARNN